MLLRETISSFQSAADSVTQTSDYLREALPTVHQYGGYLQAMADEVETAAKNASVAFVIVGIVAALALTFATIAVVRDSR